MKARVSTDTSAYACAVVTLIPEDENDTMALMEMLKVGRGRGQWNFRGFKYMKEDVELYLQGPTSND